MQHNIWLGKTCSANLTVPKRTTAYKWPNNNQSNSLHSTLQVEHLHTEDWHKDLAVPYRHFWASYANTSIQSSKPINVHHSRQYPWTNDQKPTSSFPVPAESWPQTQLDQIPFRSTRSRFPWKNNNNQGSCPAKTKNCQNPRKSQISTIQESTSKLHWILELLPKLHT